MQVVIENDVGLRALQDESQGRCTRIQAAAPFARKGCPFFNWERSAAPLEFFGRFDAVDPDLLEDILDMRDRDPDRVRCRLLGPDFHAKVVWWHGFGAYIGSANLTRAAWSDNIECGVFYDETEMADAGLLEALPGLFQRLRDAGEEPNRAMVARLRGLDKKRRAFDAGLREEFAALVSSASVIVVDGMRVPPLPEDLSLAKELFEKCAGKMWRAPYMAWAYYVLSVSNDSSRTGQLDLAHRAGRKAQGPVGHYLEIMRTLIPANPEIVVDWLRQGEKGRYAQYQSGPKPLKPVTYKQMLAVAKAEPQKRRGIYEKLARAAARTNRGGRPSLCV